MRLPSRLLGLYLLEDMSALPPSLWPNHGRSVRGVFAQVQGSRCREGMGFSMVIVVSREADACGPRDVQSRHEGYSSKPKPAVCGYQDRVTLSAVGAAAMASWVTRCWSPADCLVPWAGPWRVAPGCSKDFHFLLCGPRDRRSLECEQKDRCGCAILASLLARNGNRGFE